MPLISELDPILIEVEVSDPVSVVVDANLDVELPEVEPLQVTVLTQTVQVVPVSPGPQVQAITGIGLDGWSPMLAIVPRVSDGALVLQLVDWVGGSNTKPDVGAYLGPAGFVSDIADARNIKGEDGTNGTDGSAIILGMGDPASNLGSVRDLYIDLSAFRLWDKSSGDWTSDGTFKGRDGDPGDDGAAGATLRWGHGAPAPGLGSNGDQYTDIDTWDIYGKAVGAWSALGNIKGAPGQDAATLILGNTDPDGSVGKDLDTFINRTSWDIFSRAAGAWTRVGNIRGERGLAIRGMDGEDAEGCWPIPGPAGADGQSIQGRPGFDGIDGEDAFPIPGNPGRDGVDGLNAPIIPGLDGADGEDAWPLPGRQGDVGTAGLDAISIPGRDGIDGDDAFPIPGRQGDAGVDGLNAISIPGRDGEDGQDAFPIPGNPGRDGIDGLNGRPGFDGLDGDDAWPLPGRDGVDGQTVISAPGRDGEDGQDAWPANPGKDGKPGGQHYRFNSSTVTAADPGDGQFTLNATPQSFAWTTLSISRKNADGAVIALLLQTIMNTGTDSVLVFQSADGTKVIHALVASGSLVDNTTYYTVTVAPIAGVAIGNGQDLYVDLGRTGADAGVKFAFSTATSGDPGSGNFLFNNGTLGSATKVNISHFDKHGTDIQLQTQRLMNTGTSCMAIGFPRNAPTKQVAFITLGTGFVNNGTYDTYDVRGVVNTLANGDVAFFDFSRYGDPGPQGASQPMPGRDGEDADPWPMPFVIPNLNVPASIRFDANKGGVAQTIPNNVSTKLTFTTETYDDGGYYDAPNSRWTPPRGFIQIAATIYSYNDPSRVAGVNAALGLYKNGVSYKQLNAVGVVAGGAIPVGAVFFDKANGTDYYEIYWIVAQVGGSSDAYFIGTNFSGIWLNN